MRKLRTFTGFVLELTTEAFEKVQEDFSAFTRDDVSDEVFLDASSFDDDVNEQLAEIFNIPVINHA